MVLTYMSIETEIGLLVNEGRLKLLQPALPGIAFSRCILLSDEIFKMVTTKTLDEDKAARCKALRADLEVFAMGDFVTVCLTPYKARTAYMGRLDPTQNGVFDIRSRDPSPAIRVLGGFPMKDTFVGLSWGPRSKPFAWSKKKPLGDTDSKEWAAAIKTTSRKWKKLFPEQAKLSGDNIHEIISSNVLLV